MPPKKAPAATAKHLGRASSEVHAVNSSGQVLRNTVVWCDLAPGAKADPELVFAKCEVLPGSTAKQFKLKQIYPGGFENEEFTVPANRCQNANDDAIDPLSLRDIGLLQHQSTAAVLEFLRQRFMQNAIYTTADPLLVAINPFKNLGLTDATYVAKYRDAVQVHSLPPHVFTIARNAQDNLLGLRKSQTIIVTGESGAGKTEATKHCMQFFASAKASGIDTRIQKAVMAANPVLEAFGNAKTIRNNNSSRFGRFMQLYLGPKGGIVNGLVQGFLLEKVRVVSQQKNERSFHIFYQMVKGATADEKRKYQIEPLETYRNLNEKSGGCYNADNIDDLEEFKEVRESFRSMQLNAEEIDTVFSVVCGVLKLGNVTFESRTIEGQDNAAEIGSRAMETLKSACQLLHLDDWQRVAASLVSTLKTIGKEEVTVRLQKNEAEGLLASLGKAMYEGLFRWIINRLNITIKPEQESPCFMGMLDIFGFEVFDDNSLEQLLINITNEFLQKNFIDIVFERESRLYREEGISAAELVFTDNREVINCLIGKRGSVFAILEDACLQKGTDQKFHGMMGGSLKDNKCFSVPAGGDRDLKFTIQHTIADITYGAQDFIVKNMDLLKAELTVIAQKSSHPIIASLFAGIKVEPGKLAKGQLIASKFLIQLDEMMKLIMTTESHFIRCVKPNESKKPLDWVNQKVLNQLFSLSILEALQLKKLGFSWRRPFRDFIQWYKYLNLGIAAEMQNVSEGDVEKEKAVGMKMIHHIGRLYKAQGESFVEGKQWQCGKTMMFLKPEVSRRADVLMKQAMEDYLPTVALIEAMYKAQLLKRSAKRNVGKSIRVQSHIRRVLTIHNHELSRHSPPAVMAG